MRVLGIWWTPAYVLVGVVLWLALHEAGIHATLTCARVGGVAGHWLGHVRDVACRHQALLDLETSDVARETLLCELNVMEQAINVCASPTVLDAWARQQPLTIHGWVYSLRDGLVRHLDFDISSPEGTAQIRERALERLMAARRDFKSRSKALKGELAEAAAKA